MVDKKNKYTTPPVKVHRKTAAVLAVFLFAIGIIIVDICTPFGGNIRLYSEWLRCGTKPLMSSTQLGGHIEFYKESSAIAFFSNHTTYFCTALEAEQAGLSASADTYTTPELDKLKNAN